MYIGGGILGVILVVASTSRGLVASPRFFVVI